MKTERSSRWLAGLFIALALLSLLYILLPMLVAEEMSSTHDSVFDIGIHDTYFITSNASIFGLMVILALFFSGFYSLYARLTGLRLSPLLGWLHFIGCAAIVLIPAQFAVGLIIRSSAPRRYYSYSEFPMFDGVIDLMTILLTVGIISQACFVVNVAASPFRKKTL